MTTYFYIIINRKGQVDLRKTADFAVPAGHVATRIEVNIPDDAFDPIPLPTVVFNIPTAHLRRAVEVTAELKEETGDQS